jgi:hypothetical protein
MSDSQHLIKVLWIDDEPQKGFMVYAYNEKQILIEVATSVVEGLKMLQDRDKSYEAIILDANCIINPNETPALDALTYAIVNLYRLRIEIPWFVYTAGGEKWKDILSCLIPKDTHWQSRQYYDKPDDKDALLDDIRSAVENSKLSLIKKQFPGACKVYEGQDLIEILDSMLNNDNFERDNSIPGKIRLIVDWLCMLLTKANYVPFDFEPSKITAHSKFIGLTDMQSVIPIYIQRLFYFIVDYSNNGNHRFLETCESIRAGNAPYLNKTAVFALLNILQWISSIHFSDDEMMAKVAKVSKDAYLKNENKIK